MQPLARRAAASDTYGWQEKNQLQQTASTSESLSGVLRDRVSGLAMENAALKERMALLEAQLQAQAEAMTAVLSSHLERVELGGGGGGGGSSGSGGSVGGGAVGGALAVALSRQQRDAAQHSSAATQTEADETTRHWQQQLIAVSDWLQTGAALLQPVAALQTGAPTEPAASGAEEQPMVGRGAGKGAIRRGDVTKPEQQQLHPSPF